MRRVLVRVAPILALRGAGARVACGVGSAASQWQRAAPSWAPMLQRSRYVADRPRHAPSNSPNVLIARMVAALGLLCAIAALVLASVFTCR